MERRIVFEQKTKISIYRRRTSRPHFRKALLSDSQVDTVICATDAGREGELIFRLVYEKAGCKKPIKRLWISSLEDTAIQKGFGNLKDGKEYDNLYQAALCRAKADWIVGINATRLFFVLYGRTLNIGRVMSPTLAMICERDATISIFKPEPFYTVQRLYKREQEKEDKDHVNCVGFDLLSITQGEVFIAIAELKEGKTSPPKPFTDDTPLSSMENANKAETDVESKGIGMPATRAGILEKLIKSGLAERKGDKKAKYFTATHKGTALITVLPEQVQSPLMTAEWEEKLKLVERGKMPSLRRCC